MDAPAHVIALVALCVGAPHLTYAGPAPSSASRPFLAVRYGDPAPTTPRPALALHVEDLVVRLARESPRSAASPVITADPRLAVALDRLISLLPAAGPPPGGLTEHALWLTGIVEPVPYLLTMLVPAGAEDDVERQLTRVLPPVIGHGRYRRVAAAVRQLPDGTARLALALQESFIELAPVPRALPAGGHAVITGRALAPYGKPEVYVTGPDGKVSRLPLDGKVGAAGTLRANFTCGARPGAYQIEVAGEDALGDAVLANFPVHCGVAAPAAIAAPAAVAPPPAVERGANTDKLRAEVEARVFELLQKNRAAAGLLPLTADARLAAVARGHSVDMHDHGFFGHISPATGSAMDRLVRAGVAVVRVRENLGRAWSAAELDRGLMGSPSHRANILAEDVDRVGIGVAVGTLDGGSGTYYLFLTQLFARMPEAWDPARAEAALRARIGTVRREGRSPPLGSDAALDQVARQVAAQLAAGAPSGERRDTDAVERALPSLSDRYQWVRQVSARAIDVSQFGASPALLDRTATHAGVAVAAGPREASGATPLWLVVLMAARR